MLSRNLSRFKLITFDFTQTLARFSNPPHKQYLITANNFLKADDYFDEKLMKKNFRNEFKRMAREYPNFGYPGEPESIGWHEWWHQLVLDIFRKSLKTNNVEHEVIATIANQLIDDYKTRKCWEIYESVGMLLSDIKSIGKTIGIISNFDPRINNVLEDLEINHVDLVITSYEAGFEKPDPKIFDVALEQANELSKADKILPENCLHIGNHPMKDYQGARNANWKSALVNFNDHNHNHNSLFPFFEDINQFYEHLKNKPIDW